MEITSYLSECIKTKTPVVFFKLGDGEYYAVLGIKGYNCDGDTYTDFLKNGLIDSIQYMVDNGPNTYIGKWYDETHIEFWNKYVNKPIQYAKYHTIILDGENTQEKVELLKTIKESPLKKIYICNELMVRAKILLNIDHMIHVPFNNWVDTEFNTILKQVKTVMNINVEPCIILTSAGMGAKLLIGELNKIYPQHIYIDVGSALDKICTTITSRGWEPSYEEFMRILADIIPEDWESPIYNLIFYKAYYEIGLHLPEELDTQTRIYELGIKNGYYNIFV